MLFSPYPLMEGFSLGGALSAAYYRFLLNPEHTALKLGTAGWAAAAAPFLFGLHRGLNKQVIDTPGKSVQEGTRKLIWDPIHKMLVKG